MDYKEAIIKRKLKEIESRLSQIINGSGSTIKISSDFMLASVIAPFYGSAVQSGQFNSVSASSNHYGVGTMMSSTSANSGYKLMFHVNSILFVGKEEATIIFKTATVLIGTSIVKGFHNGNDHLTYTEGVIVKIVDGVIRGHTIKNSNITTTTTNYTLSPNTWYRLNIKLNNDATAVTYTLYADNSSDILWQDTLTGNIPVNAVGFMDIAVNSGTVAIALQSIDYIELLFPNARRVS